MAPPGPRRRAWIALGSNLGQPRVTLLAALDRLERLSVTPLLRSSLWRTDPVDCPPGSPPFLNAVVQLEPASTETPESLLNRLQDLERDFGRTPKRVLNEPRVLDLDLLHFEQETRGSARLTLPHPRAHQRRFVLAPLAEIAPDLCLPRQTRTVAQLLAALRSPAQTTWVGPALPGALPRTNAV